MNKIIIFHQEFDRAAGTERVLYNIAEFFGEMPDSEVTLLLNSKSENLVFEIDKLPIKIESLGLKPIKSGKLSLIIYYLKVYRRLSSYLKRLDKSYKYTLICSNATLSALAYFTSKDRNNIKIIACEHFSYHVAGKFSRLLRKQFYSNVNIVSLTEKDRAVFQNEFNPNICICIPNAIPFVPRSYNGYDKKVILSIGRFTYQKGYDLLLKAISKLDREIFDDWKVIIVGEDYGDRKMMEDIIERYNLSFVELHPPSATIQEYYANSTFYVMSSRFEGLPMVLLESVGFGLPIVSFDCPTGPSEVVNDENGILVPAENIEKLSEAIEFMIKNRDQIAKKSLGAEKTALLYTKERINGMWKNLLDQIWLKD
ncbi:glycosyltransferase [Sphingobacterium puteale]|uniref:glycosyltransferase n=1 Tax=Sphingobacterium puteale TaxID=2420510 RepID=UPI003D99FDE0